MNTKRNRWLAAALGLVVLFFFGDLAYRKLYEEPRKASEDRKDQLDERLKKTKLDLAKAKQATEELEGLESKSLPWDAERAQERYQDWLVQLAKDANLSNTRVDASNPVAVTGTDRATRRAYEMFKRFTFTISGSGDLTQVTRFLYDFYRGGHLQKITSLSLIPSSGDQLNLSMTVEALALPNADREAELTTLVSADLALEDVRDYHAIARRNFFGRGGANSAWSEIELTAVTSNAQGASEAWFAVGPSKRTEIVRLGESLTLPSLEVRVVQVDEAAATATVAVDGTLYLITIGTALADGTLVKR
ncbi:MAG: hypothetical protein FJ276_26070 [Planctomycetes bacterium]|nr:hypothetical protein [Planctomycetota bacterium]